MARTVKEMFDFMQEKHDEYLHFEKVEKKLSERPDLHAFILLDKLTPMKIDQVGTQLVSGSEHDIMWLSIDPKLVAENATDDDLVDLVRCGIMYDPDDEAFSLFT